MKRFQIHSLSLELFYMAVKNVIYRLNFNISTYISFFLFISGKAISEFKILIFHPQSITPMGSAEIHN